MHECKPLVGGAASEFDTGEMQVHLTSYETPRPLRSLNSKDVSNLIFVPGIVIAASRAKAKATKLAGAYTRPILISST